MIITEQTDKMNINDLDIDDALPFNKLTWYLHNHWIITKNDTKLSVEKQL